MPDESHRMLAHHAAESLGLPDALVNWISQGAWDEDNCRFSSYPPCIFNFYASTARHSWDPDTNGYWVWFDPGLVFGPGLEHANDLFSWAVDAYSLGNVEAAYLWLGRSAHLLGDMATPAPHAAGHPRTADCRFVRDLAEQRQPGQHPGVGHRQPGRLPSGRSPTTTCPRGAS